MTLIYDLIIHGGHIPFDSVIHAVVYYIGQITALLFALLYLHQMFYLVLGTLYHHKLKTKGKTFKEHTLGVVIAARNESKVIGNLIKSIQANDYPADKVTIFVIADNCTDNTAEIAREMGCVVIERFDKEKVGKGYALNYLFTRLHTDEEYADRVPEAYIVFDADNVIKPNFISEINKTYDSGYEIITSYRNSKNFGKNWVTAGYGYWFLHESRHLNNCRMILKSSCAISGTGFLISAKVVKEYGNWSFFTLTEDIQCSTAYSISKRKVGYCGTAELYDEQPETFRQSWRQRERWAKGLFQVWGLYGPKLIWHSVTNFACWDIVTTIMPALILSLVSLIAYPIIAAVAASLGMYAAALYALETLLYSFLSSFILMGVIGLLICITEWKRIKTHWFKKIFYIFTLPIFMLSYLPITIGAMFKKVQWKPIVHNAATTIDMLESKPAKKQKRKAKSAEITEPETAKSEGAGESAPEAVAENMHETVTEVSPEITLETAPEIIKDTSTALPQKTTKHTPKKKSQKVKNSA